MIGGGVDPTWLWLSGKYFLGAWLTDIRDRFFAPVPDGKPGLVPGREFSGISDLRIFFS